MTGNNQTALVTGASSGIGRETAIRLAEKGFTVVGAARRLERLEGLSQQHPTIIPMPVDLSDPEDTERFCRTIADLPQPVTVLINNAGYSIRGALEDVSLEAIERVFRVNLFSLIRVTQACIPGMRRLRAGTIVNLSSISGKFTFPTGAIYSATKYALEAVTDALRLELSPFGIRVVAVRPGVIATEFNEVATAMTGDLTARCDEDYKPVYQALGAAMGKMFKGLTLPGPEVIAEIIMEAVLADEPRAVYAAGPFTDDILAQRATLDDEGFHSFWLNMTGMANLKL